MKHLNEQEKFNLNEVEEQADKIVVRLSKIYVEKVSCWGPLSVEINSRNSTCMYHHLVCVETECMKKETEIRKKMGQKSGKLINESEMKFYLLYNTICKN